MAEHLGVGESRLRIVDAHTHSSGSEHDGSPRDALAFLDICGIDVAFVFAPLLSGQGPQLTDEHAAAIRTNNDYIAHFCAHAPDRLYAFCVVNPNPHIARGGLGRAVQLMCDELRRCYTELGIRGVKMVPDGWNCEQEEVRPLFDEIARLGMYAVFHSGIFMDERASSFCRPTLFEGLHQVQGFTGHLAHLGWPWEDELIATLTMEREHREGDADDPWQLKADFSFGAPADWQVPMLVKALNMLDSDQLLYGSDMWWPTPPEEYYERYLLPHLTAFEVAASLSRATPPQGDAKRRQLRQAVFSENVLRHWRRATRGVEQQLRRAASTPRTSETRHG